MQNVKFNSIRALALSGLLATVGVAGAYAQESVTTTSTTTAGTVSQFTPGMITVTSGPSALPVSYSYSKTTTYVDENGNPISSETVKTGVPVTVYYTQEGNRMLASKVVVRRAEIPTTGSTVFKKTTTTTTSTPAP